MTRELLFQILNWKMPLDMFLIIVAFSINWAILIKLGLRILEIKIVEIKKIIPAVLIMVLFCICRSFFPRTLFGIVEVGLVAFLLTFYTGKFNIINILKSIWTTLIIILISGISSIIILSVLIFLNPGISVFLLKTALGVSIGSVLEAFFPALVLYILPRLKKISLVPPIEKIDRYDSIGVITFGSIYYIVYYAAVQVYLNLKDNPRYTFIDLTFLWIAGIAAVSGYHTVVRNLKKKNELQRKQTEYQRQQCEYEQWRREYEQRKYESERLVYEERITQLEGQNQELAVLNEQLTAQTIEPQEAITTIQDMIKKLQDATVSVINQQKNSVIPENSGEPVRFRLTSREKDVLKLIAKEGMSNKEIADALNLKEGWVKNIVSRLLVKTQSADRTQLAILALTTNLINNDD